MRIEQISASGFAYVPEPFFGEYVQIPTEEFLALLSNMLSMH